MTRVCRLLVKHGFFKKIVTSLSIACDFLYLFNIMLAIDTEIILDHVLFDMGRWNTGTVSSYVLSCLVSENYFGMLCQILAILKFFHSQFWLEKFHWKIYQCGLKKEDKVEVFPHRRAILLLTKKKLFPLFNLPVLWLFAPKFLCQIEEFSLKCQNNELNRSYFVTMAKFKSKSCMMNDYSLLQCNLGPKRTFSSPCCGGGLYFLGQTLLTKHYFQTSILSEPCLFVIS